MYSKPLEQLEVTSAPGPDVTARSLARHGDNRYPKTEPQPQMSLLPVSMYNLTFTRVILIVIVLQALEHMDIET